MLITPRKGKIITDRRIVDPIFMFVGAACACPAPSATSPVGLNDSLSFFPQGQELRI